jgi:hypothetical protein
MTRGEGGLRRGDMGQVFKAPDDATIKEAEKSEVKCPIATKFFEREVEWMSRELDGSRRDQERYGDKDTAKVYSNNIKSLEKMLEQMQQKLEQLRNGEYKEVHDYILGQADRDISGVIFTLESCLKEAEYQEKGSTMGVKMREDEWEHLLEELRRGRDLTRGLKEIEEAMTEKEKAPVET